MKIAVPKIFASYGPHGHPQARVFDVDLDKEALRIRLHEYLSRNRLQGNTPTVFFNENCGLEEQGYYVLALEKGELDPVALGSLRAPRCFAPQPTGTPGRQLLEFKRLLPSYLRVDEREVWQPGNPDCDHDFGLESYLTCFKHNDGTLYGVNDKFDYRAGAFYDQVTCTRCGAIHALRQQY